MPNQKIQNLLIIVLIIVVVILASFLLTGINKMTAQARIETAGANLASSFDETGAIIEEEQGLGTILSYQGVFTEEVETSGQAVPMLADGDLKAPISGQSTNSGAEFIPASAFRHDGFTGLANDYLYWPTGGYIRNNSANDVCLSAPVYVPDGATLTEFSIYVLDNDPSINLSEDPPDRIHFWRKNLASPTTSAEALATAFIPGVVADTFIRRWFIGISGTVSNDYGYYTTFCFPADTGLDILVYGARVDYTLP